MSNPVHEPRAGHRASRRQDWPSRVATIVRFVSIDPLTAGVPPIASFGSPR